MLRSIHECRANVGSGVDDTDEPTVTDIVWMTGIFAVADTEFGREGKVGAVL